MQYVRCYLSAMVPWLSLLALISCKGALQWTSSLNNPTITNVRALNPSNLPYNSGRITIRVTFSEEILLNTTNGTPYIELNTTPNTAHANLVNCSTLTINSQTKFVCDFEYIVRINENADVLDYISADSLILNGAEIVDTNGYPLRNKLPIAGSGNSLAQSGIIIDTEPPRVTSVTAVPLEGTFVAGDKITVIVSFDEAIQINTTTPYPTLDLSNGVQLTYNPSYNPGFNRRSDELFFEYVVGNGKDISELDYSSNSALIASPEDIKDFVGNIADLTLPNPGDPDSLSDKTTLSINAATGTGIARVISVESTNSTPTVLGLNESVDLKVKFNRNVTLSGSYGRINLNVYTSNGEASSARYGSNSSELVFTYEAQSSHSADTLDYEAFSSSSATDPLYLESGTTIKDQLTSQNAILDLPPNGAPLSLLENYVRKNNHVKVVPYERPVTPAVTASFIGHLTPLDTNDDNYIKLSWTHNSSAEGYIIERSENSSSFSSFSNASATSEFIDENVEVGKDYNYRIRAYKNELYANNKRATGNQRLGLVVVPTYGSNGYNWNDYVEAPSSGMPTVEGESSFSVASLAPNNIPNTCSTPTNYRDCIHGGERKRIILYGMDQATCESTTNTITVNEYPDTGSSTPLDIFNWSKCQWIDQANLPLSDPGSSKMVAVVFSLGFKEGKGLKDLIDPATSSRWKNITAKVTNGAGDITAYSPIYDWWENDVNPLSDNSATGTQVDLNSVGNIYYLDLSRETAGYNIMDEKISVVTLDGISLSWDDMGAANGNSESDGSSGSSLKSILASNGKNFLWIEGSFDGADTADNGLILGSSFGSRVHNASINNMCKGLSTCGPILLDGGGASIFQNLLLGVSGFGLQANSTNGSLFRSLKVTEATQDSCISIYSSDNNSFTRVSASNCNGQGLSIQGDNNNLSQIVATNNNADGIFVKGSYNTLTAITTANNTLSGITLDEAPYSVLHSILATNNGSAASAPNILITDTNSNTVYSEELTISQLVTTDNPNNISVKINNDSHDIKFTGNFLKQEPNCEIPIGGATPVDINTSCNPTAISPTGQGPSSNHYINPTTNNLFFSSNGNPTNGGTQKPYTSLLADPNASLSVLTSIFNGWGIMPVSAAWPSTPYMGKCSATSNSCVLNNWALSLERTNAHSETVRNTTIDGSYEELVLTNETPCPNQIENSDDFLYDPANPPTKANNILYTHPLFDGTNQVFHKLAIEIIGDRSGDEDGLCEDTEQCLYMPNFGAYQGEGTLSSCETNNSKIKADSNYMFFYETNGVQ